MPPEVHLPQSGLAATSGVSRLQHGLAITAASPGEHLLCCGLIPGHMLLSAPASPHAQPSEGVPVASWTYPQPQMLRGYLLQHGLTLGSQSLQRCSYCGTTISTATDTSRCTCCGEDLFTATGTLECLDSTWIHAQATVPLTQDHTGVLACSVQQHRHSSYALAACQPKHITIAVTRMFPGTAE